ncbi:MAG: hypothetical protein V1837_02575 [Candidatus Woesearchaeota archaeon]
MTKNKICYVCLTKPFKDLLQDFADNRIDSSFFFFVDVLSSHYGLPDPCSNCIFVDSPQNLEGIADAIAQAVERENCNLIVIDTISNLLLYQEGFPLLRFAHQLGEKDIVKLFLALKHDSVPAKENLELINDLRMLADQTIDLG